ncbi:MAG: polysaccharide deacetylase family protein [Candidatus Margulisbacteria bacterium]|nr:polysaccharide deacetylase family protein [Candidatus Margulisiibacteriota bacterium]
MGYKLRLIVLIFILGMFIYAYQPSGLINDFQTSKKTVALTFDDGPLPRNTEAILAILASENVKATFFLIGMNIIKYPDLVEKIYLSGHDVGNHTYNHNRLDNFFVDEVDFEIKETNKLIADILGLTPRFFRPPGGRFNSIVLNVCRKENLLPIGWSVNCSDFLYDSKKKLSEAQIESRVTEVMQALQNGLKPGAIILMHNGNDVSVRALPRVIKYLKDNGYQLRKLSEFL